MAGVFDLELHDEPADRDDLSEDDIIEVEDRVEVSRQAAGHSNRGRLRRWSDPGPTRFNSSHVRAPVLHIDSLSWRMYIILEHL